MQSEDERPLNIPTKIIPYEPIGIGQIPVQLYGNIDSFGFGRVAAYSHYSGFGDEQRSGWLGAVKPPGRSGRASSSPRGVGAVHACPRLLPAEAWWGCRRKVSALLGFELSVALFLPAPPVKAGGGGLIRRPAALTRVKREAAGAVPFGGGGMQGLRPCRSCRWPGPAGCLPRRPGGARLLAGTYI